MSIHHLAQLNIAAMKAPLESAEMADFVANLERINTLAEAAPGFVWRLQDEAGDATAIRPFGDEVLVNMSVWQDVQSLSNYVYKSAHTEMLKRRREWFGRIEQAHQVLWWVPSGHRPDVAEAAERLAHLREHGATAHAFTFRHAFAAPA
ncbi:DUF3291 domain-containing protein [Pseudomonas sp. REST10]|uniref:DUF3291 domain-containing protein n=1 Tax=Pseudomonas sp. REST10 TaxID=2512235 RepID=UPI00240D793F|nr:DUF3291 domain-containing protein [Pseudomonas sp. REST10]WFC62616.1 DUF3291 domain-containing protein [Pseudomonas sp. REST10]